MSESEKSSKQGSRKQGSRKQSADEHGSEQRVTKRWSRRSFLKVSASTACALPILGQVSRAHAIELKPIDPNTPKAQAFGYYHNVENIDLQKFPKRAAEDAKNQFCSNCQLLLEKTGKIDGEEGEWGKCALFTEGLVNLDGWCNSWVLKAGA